MRVRPAVGRTITKIIQERRGDAWVIVSIHLDDGSVIGFGAQEDPDGADPFPYAVHGKPQGKTR